MSQRIRKALIKSKDDIIEQLHNALSHILEEPSTTITPELRETGVNACHDSNALEAAIVNDMANELKMVGKRKKRPREPKMPHPREKYVQYAKAAYETDDLEIDDNAKVSRVDGGDDGCWVAAWVWVPDTDIELPQDPEREKKIEAIAQARTENIDLRDYLKGYQEREIEDLRLLSDAELAQLYIDEVGSGDGPL